MIAFENGVDVSEERTKEFNAQYPLKSEKMITGSHYGIEGDDSGAGEE